MDKLVDGLCSFISSLVAVSFLGGGMALFAGEIRLASLRKASQGSAKLSPFTVRMTRTRLIPVKGGEHGTHQKSH